LEEKLQILSEGETNAIKVTCKKIQIERGLILMLEAKVYRYRPDGYFTIINRLILESKRPRKRVNDFVKLFAGNPLSLR